VPGSRLSEFSQRISIPMGAEPRSGKRLCSSWPAFVACAGQSPSVRPVTRSLAPCPPRMLIRSNVQCNRRQYSCRGTGACQACRCHPLRTEALNCFYISARNACVPVRPSFLEIRSLIPINFSRVCRSCRCFSLSAPSFDRPHPPQSPAIETVWRPTNPIEEKYRTEFVRQSCYGDRNWRVNCSIPRIAVIPMKCAPNRSR
jgi:hypothetical protein